MKIATLFLLLCVCAACASPEPITIGSIQDLTRQSASHGNNAKAGIDLAVAQVNSAGGINGRTLKVIHEDEQCEPERAVRAAKKLIEHDRVSVILGPTCSSSAVAVAPVVEQEQVILLASVPSTPALRGAGDYVFRNRAAGEADSITMARFAREELGAGTAAVLYINLDNGIGYRDAFVAEFTALGGEITGTQAIDRDQTDMRTELTKLASDDPDVLFIASQTGHHAVRQARELGIRARIIGPVTMETHELLDVAGAAAEGIHYSHPAFDPDSNESRIRAYQDAYRKMHGRPSELRAAESYDAAMLIAGALRRCGEDTACIKAYLYATEGYEGVSGTTTFDADGEVEKPLAIKTVRNGEFVFADSEEQET